MAKGSKCFYAAYRGDKFITLGTIAEIAEELGKKKESTAFLAKESYHKRNYDYDKTLLLYKIDIDDEENET